MKRVLYLEELLNQENGERYFKWKNEGPCEKVTLEAVLQSLKFIKNEKAVGPSGKHQIY